MDTPTDKRRGPGQPAFEPTEEQRHLVKLMIGFGIPQDRVRLGILSKHTGKPIAKETLEKAFAREIEVGALEMDSIAMTALAKKVREGNMTAIIWYQKNRMGWRDVVEQQQTGPNGEKLDFSGAAPPTVNLIFGDYGGEPVAPAPTGKSDDKT